MISNENLTNFAEFKRPDVYDVIAPLVKHNPVESPTCASKNADEAIT